MRRSSPLWELYLSRLREFYRQPARIFWVYGFPTILAVGLSFAFRSGQTEILQVDVVKNARGADIERALAAYERQRPSNRPSVLVKQTPHDQAMLRVRTGKTPLVVEGESDRIVYHFDPTRPEAVSARDLVDNVLEAAAGREDKVRSEDVLVTEKGSRYIDFLIPGLIGLNTMGGGLWGIGFLLVNFRIAKLLKLFVATPMPRRDFLFALLGARLTFLLPDLFVLLLLGRLAFDMPMRGNLLVLIIVDAIGALAFAGIGLLIASRAQSTESVSGLMNLVMLPMWLLSGVFFSSERFPDAAQPIIQALPLTQLINALRAVILEGAGLFEIWPALLILTVWAVVTFALALRIFRWT